MKISSKGLELIKRNEGLKLQAYICPSGKLTIGFGHTCNVCLGDKITYEVAESLLKSDLKKTEQYLNDFLVKNNLSINQNKFDALCSFIYNCGSGNFGNSTLRRKILANQNDESIKLEFEKWNRGGGKVLQGLVKRRKEESLLYFED